VNISALGMMVARFYKPTPSVSLPLDVAIVPPRWEMGSLSTGKFTTWPSCPPDIRQGAGLEESW
jgi:hypothetical protein